MEKNEILLIGQQVFDKEIAACQNVKMQLGDTFLRIVDAIFKCKGKIFFMGMGKPGHIAKKLAATFSSLGIPSICLHPADAMHGDLGMLQPNDIVITMSYSGESTEIVGNLSNIKALGCLLIGITSNPNSSLAKRADICEVLPQCDEACHLGLAPTSSTSALLMYGDALGVVVSELKDFNKKDFGLRHPAGSLGKSLTVTVKDLMDKGDKCAYVYEHCLIKDAIVEMGKKALGLVAVVNKNMEMTGIITDGCIQRALDEKRNIYSDTIDDFYVDDARYINVDAMAVDALRIMEKNGISCMPVINDGIVVGILRKEEIIRAGIY